MTQIVLDTNVLISALISTKGNPAQIFDKVSEGALRAIYCQKILDECEAVLNRPCFSFPHSSVSSALDTFKLKGIEVNPRFSQIPMTDESDRIFYDTAVTGNAILITGNLRHYPNEPFIMSPAEFFTAHCRV